MATTKKDGAQEPKGKAPAKAQEAAETAQEVAEEAAPAPQKKKEPKERTFVDAKTGKTIDKPVQGGSGAEVNQAARDAMHSGRKKNSLPFRIGAIALWVLGIVCEVLCILTMNGTLYIPMFSQMVWIIVFLVLDLVLVIIGSQLWKAANHINPASKENKLAYWIQTDLGILIAVIAFAPIIILMLNNKNLDKKTKQICTSVAAVALIVAVASGIDYNPVSQEELDQAEAGAAVLSDDGICYWTPFGKVYHFNPDCQYIKNSATIYSGSLNDAVAAHRDHGCSGCTVADGSDVLSNADPTAVAEAAANAVDVSEDPSTAGSANDDDSGADGGDTGADTTPEDADSEDESLPQAA